MNNEFKTQIKNSIEDTRIDIIELIDFGKKLAGSDSENHLHGPNTSMGVPKNTLPKWDDIQILTAQLAKKPLLDGDDVNTKLIIGPKAKKPLILDIPLFISDMSYGSLSMSAKIALAKGANYAGTGICSGEGGILEAELDENTKYFFEMGTARNAIKKGKEVKFFEKFKGKVKAFHFKGGQAAKTGTGGHLPKEKITDEIAKIREADKGEDLISPSTYEDFSTVRDFKIFADKLRQGLGGIPIGFKISANHIEQDIQFAIDASADYIILDGRGGSTGSAPTIFRDNISVPTIAALARARRYLDSKGYIKNSDKSITLIVTGGLRTPADFIKALALGADGVALANSALQAIGCIGARICNSGNCPAGIATQNENLTNKLDINTSANDLDSFFYASVHLMKIIARACGHNSFSKFSINDLTTWHKDMSTLTNITYAGDKFDICEPEVINKTLIPLRKKQEITVVQLQQHQTFESFFDNNHLKNCLEQDKEITEGMKQELEKNSKQAYESQRQYCDKKYPLEVELNTLDLNLKFRLIPPVNDSEIKAENEHATPYYMGKFQVTQSQWTKVMEDNPSQFPDEYNDIPINNVSVEHCIEFARQLNLGLKNTGWQVSLPKVNEWVYACKAGTDTPFYTGNHPLAIPKPNKEKEENIKLKQISLIDAYNNTQYKELLTVANVAPPNSFGLYDMYGYFYDFTVSKDDVNQPDNYLRGGYYPAGEKFYGSCETSGRDKGGKAACFKSFRLVLRYIGN